MKIIPRRIELLSPAKDLACGIEAIKHGADAVYIGAPKFGARAAAGNSLEDIRQLCTYAHLFDVRIYVALNTILKEEELQQAEELIWQLYDAGVDALIVQDMGVTQLNLPPIPLHASTQTDNRTIEKVKFLEEKGFRQIVLARELSLSEIKQIAGQVTVPLEVFIHGALCVSYSGQCYLSAAIGGRSANRGECAQYCRLPYRMEDAEGKIISTSKHLLSLKDMNRSDYLEQLLDAGVSSFKIEGRLKDISYVKNITAYYRKKLDTILARRKEYKGASSGRSKISFEPIPEKSFNRGFTPFFLHERTADITSFDTPKFIGEYAGKVKEVRSDHLILVNSKIEIHNGDGFVYFDPKGDLQGFRVNRIEKDRLYFADKPSIVLGTVLYRNGDQLFDKQLSKETAERKLKLDILFTENNFGFSLEIKDETGASAVITEPLEKEVARKPQEENIQNQLLKLGNTIFESDHVHIQMAENWFIPSSLLSTMRRKVIEKLIANKRMRYQKEWVKPSVYKKEIPYFQHELTYLGNVSNSKACQFYKEAGVKTIANAFELKPVQDVPLMFTKHCLRYSFGWCPKHHKKQSPYKEPFFLVYKDTRLKLKFDCSACQMTVWETNK